MVEFICHWCYESSGFLDGSLLRPGRFDRLLYLGIASDDDAQSKFLRPLSKFKLKEDVRLEEVVPPALLTTPELTFILAECIVNGY